MTNKRERLQRLYDKRDGALASNRKDWRKEYEALECEISKMELTKR